MAGNIEKREIMGVPVEIDRRRLTDVRMVRKMAGLLKLDRDREKADKKGDQSKSQNIMLDMFEALDDVSLFAFGSKAEVDRVQNELAEKNDGYLAFETWLGFVMEVIGSGQKNS